jgi:hypothetical protein
LAEVAADEVVDLLLYVVELPTVTMAQPVATHTVKVDKEVRKLQVVPVVLLGQEPLRVVLLEP